MKKIRILSLLLGIGICLYLVFSGNGKPQEDDFVPPLVLPFKNKEECYQVVDERRRKCEAKGRHPIECVDDEYCDERGCC
ncbi:MAG: hypothetical protein FWF63_00730 [Fibromonadales bacterium]|nr:hypothetical protein [Fibromonadales bacterium]